MNSPVNAIQVTAAVGKITFQEVLRDKLLYNCLIVSSILFGIGILATRLAVIVSAERMIMDFGLTAIRLSGSMIAVFVGATLLPREYERRTIHLALCHPITRTQFVVGKYLGLSGILALNWIFMGMSYFILIATFNDTVLPFVSPTLVWALVFGLVESLFMASLAIFFTSFTTTSLAVIFSIGLYLVGENISQLRMVALKSGTIIGRPVLELLANFLPNLEYFNFGNKVTYSIEVPWQFIGFGLAYGLALIALFLCLSGVLVQFKEV